MGFYPPFSQISLFGLSSSCLDHEWWWFNRTHNRYFAFVKSNAEDGGFSKMTDRDGLVLATGAWKGIIRAEHSRKRLVPGGNLTGLVESKKWSKMRIYGRRRQNKERGSWRVRKEGISLRCLGLWCIKFLLLFWLKKRVHIKRGLSWIYCHDNYVEILNWQVFNWISHVGQSSFEGHVVIISAFRINGSQNEAVHAEFLMPVLQYFPSFIFNLTFPFIPFSQGIVYPRLMLLAFPVNTCKFCLVIFVLLLPSWWAHGSYRYDMRIFLPTPRLLLFSWCSQLSR